MVGEELVINTTVPFDYLQGIPIQYFISSPWFIGVLVGFVLMVPLSVFGIRYIWGWIDTWMKLRDGYVEVWKKMTNGRWRRFWGRPIGRKISVKGEEGWEYELPIYVGKDKLGFESEVKLMPRGKPEGDALNG